MAVRRIEALAPSEENKRKVRRNIARTTWIVQQAMSFKAPLSWSGTENLPDGPSLILANHVSLWDPVAIVIATKRPVHFMATQSAFMDPFFGRLLRFVGSIPKKKFTTDVSAIRNMRRWAQLGATVGLFPEGQRSWDGELMEFIPGIDSLIKLVGIPVVTCRVINADRQAPRWAEKARRGKVHLEFDPPRSFSRKDPSEEILAYLRERLSVDASSDRHTTVRGKDLALGIANPLFACPVCFHIDALTEKKDEASCSHCAASWRVDTTNTLHGQGETPTMTVREAIHSLHRHFRGHWEREASSFGSDTPLLESDAMTLLDASGDQATELAAGQLLLTPSELKIKDGTWRVPLREVLAASVEMRRRLQFRTKEGLVEAVMPRESVLKWEWFVNHWRQQARHGSDTP